MKATVKKRIPLESEIQSVICDYLALRKHLFWRSNNIPVFDKTRGSFRAMPKYSMPGLADITVITDGGFSIFLEVKRPKGKQSPDQIEFERLVKKKGGEYYLITDVMQLKEIGL
jgi:hypothetical protein